MVHYPIQQKQFVDLALVTKAHDDWDKLKIILAVISIEQTPKSLVSTIEKRKILMEIKPVIKRILPE